MTAIADNVLKNVTLGLYFFNKHEGIRHGGPIEESPLRMKLMNNIRDGEMTLSQGQSTVQG